MTLAVDIPDRLYDYTDEERACEAFRTFQDEHGLSDEETIAIWEDASDLRRAQLETLVFNAIDANGTAKRAKESVPSEIILTIE